MPIIESIFNFSLSSFATLWALQIYEDPNQVANEHTFIDSRDKMFFPTKQKILDTCGVLGTDWKLKD